MNTPSIAVLYVRNERLSDDRLKRYLDQGYVVSHIQKKQVASEATVTRYLLEKREPYAPAP
ncbi:MAG TPA: hypothetical protein VHK69_11455 [Chitinophagaceae bacterium]|jgi:hypothetical protein|nr:hypothetical protein [Chitinophagaceae bacterium]